MQYSLVNCAIKEGANGSAYLATTAVSARNTDNGFSLPMFNPGFIAAARECIKQELNIDKYITEYFNSQGAQIEDRTINLPHVYFRREQDANGNLLNTPVVDKTTGKPIPYDKLNLHLIYSLNVSDAVDPATGIILMEQDFRENGTPYMRPKKQVELDEATGKPKKYYWQGWSAIERRDQILSTFYMLAPAEYQVATGAEVQQPVQQQQVASQQGGNPFANAGVAPGAQPQQGAAPQPQVDPLNS